MKTHHGNIMRQALSYWEQAGQRPYEVLQEIGLYDHFMEFLSSSSMDLFGNIYRGTGRHQELKMGDILDYQYPTSWSTTFDNAYNFVTSEPEPVIISLSSDVPIHAVENDQNTYGENEVVLYPIRLKVVDTYMTDNIKIVEVIPK